MTWGQEILRAFLLALGCFQIIANLTYLIRKNGLTTARKQHGELPKSISDKNIKLKVLCMLSSGIVFFIIALTSYILHRYTAKIFLTATFLFFTYDIIEASYYKYWKTFGFALVTMLIFLAAILNTF